MEPWLVSLFVGSAASIYPAACGVQVSFSIRVHMESVFAQTARGVQTSSSDWKPVPHPYEILLRRDDLSRPLVVILDTTVEPRLVARSYMNNALPNLMTLYISS
jgi:hypothetical protein